MKHIKSVVLLLIVASWLPFLTAFTINGAAPGAAASMTPAAVGTVTPVAVATCSNTTYCKRTAIEFDNISTANCYGAPAAQASPCAAASPAPNASTKAGKWLGPNSSWVFHYDPNSNTQGQWQACAEWDWVCDGSALISHIDLP